MKTLFLASLALAALIAPASAQQLETAASGAFGDDGLSSQMKSAGAGISAHSFDMGRTLQDRGGCCRDRGGDHGRGGGERDYGRRRENEVDRTEREDRQRDERERRDKERRDREWDRFKQDWDNKHPGQSGSNPYRGGSGGYSGARPAPWTYDTRWQWREGRPFWWGWEAFIVVSGSTHQHCVYFYQGLRNTCASSCAYENEGCVKACAGDADCASRCAATNSSCVSQCAADQQVWVGRCPL